MIIYLLNIDDQIKNFLLAQSTSLPSVDFTGLVRSLIVLLLVATAVALVSRWLRISYVVGLVLAGLAIPKQILPESIGLNPEVILNLFLPILIFEAAINTDITRLRGTIKPILLLAGPGVLLSAAITAILLKLSLGLAVVTAAAVAVILTITDTVSVIAAFRNVSVPSRLSTIVEGESLFNDGVALVLLTIITKVHLEGNFSWMDGIGQFLMAFVGGGVLGLGLGYLCVGLFRQLNDALSNILLTVAVSLGTFQVGQLLGVSSAIAVLMAGLVINNLGFRKSSASIKVTLLNFWEYAGFGVNTFIFLFVGLEVSPDILFNSIPKAILVVIIYQIGRIFAIYPFSFLLSFFDRPLPLKWQHVLIFGNVKGSLSMAMALSLPLSLPGQSQMITLIFSTVLVSLIGQGLSLAWFIKQLNISQTSTITHQIQNLQLNLIASKAAQEELKKLLQSGSLPKFLYEELFANYQARIASSEETLREIYSQRISYQSNRIEEQDFLDSLYRRLYLAEKGAVNDAIFKGILADDVADSYIQKLNERLLSLEDD
jgi:monovalent cation:H+ antiporter, CPA1 family